MTTLPLSPDIGNALLTVCDLMAKLRAPDGCGWDRKQTLSSLKRYLIEETFETIDAIDEVERAPTEHAVREHLEELGDLLLQIVFQTEIQREKGLFHMGDVCKVLSDKLRRRHPHIFGDDKNFDSESNPHWERIKEQERQSKGTKRESILDGVPKSMPALFKAKHNNAKAAEVGFEWPDVKGPMLQLRSEVEELEEVIHGPDIGKIEHELGDIMLACVDIARHMKLDPEATLQEANRRFEKRFRHMEVSIKADGKALSDTSADDYEKYWQRAKLETK
jgi:MazG family protein